MILPLVPLVLELLATGIASGQPRVSVQSLTLSGAMYSVTIGITSESKATFGFMVVVGLLNAVAFGTVAALVAIHQTINYEGLIKAASIICIALIFFIHAYERYGRHITDGRPFWERNG
jgi:hypothetical protein